MYLPISEGMQTNKQDSSLLLKKRKRLLKGKKHTGSYTRGFWLKKLANQIIIYCCVLFEPNLF